MHIEIIIAGMIVGIVIGLTGMGGGSLITPILYFWFRLSPLTAVGTDLALGAITKLFGSVEHYRLGNVDFKITKRMLSGSIPGAILGLIFLRLFPALHIIAVEKFVKHTLGIALILVAISLFFPSFIDYLARLKKFDGDNVTMVRSFCFVIGFIVSITSVGSGSLLMPFLLAILPLPLPQIVGIDVLHGAILTAVCGLVHFSYNNVNTALLLNLLPGTVPGVIIGSRLSVVFPKRVMQLALATVLAFSGFKLL
jgi:uncharacterized membrane protein YfcA